MLMGTWGRFRVSERHEGWMPKVNLICRTCGNKARRELLLQPGSRGVHETSSELALCPNGHGKLEREDGGEVDSPCGFPIDVLAKHRRNLS